MMLDYDELQNLLGGMNSGLRASECHGFLTGYLCLADTINESVWKYICADMEGSESIQPEQRSALHTMSQDISDQIDSRNFDFCLLQPDDTTPFSERCEALAEWCQGFLSGLGVAGTIDWNTLSDNCREMISDFSDISRLGSDAGESDQMEESLMELHEYVRIGAMYIHDEFSRLKAENERPEVLH